MSSYDCRHECCNQRFNESHSHLVEPDECRFCNMKLYGQPYRYTEDPNDPCIYCVQWREVSDRDDPLDTWEPYWPTGEMVPKVYNGVCDGCQEALDEMERHNASERRLARGDRPTTPSHQER